jgi:tetratricopeptide (TPR) repeat protein
MAKRKVSQTETVIAEEVSAVSVQSLWEKYQNLILYVVGGILVVILGWWLYNKMIVEPRQTEAVAAMWQAEQQFGRDSFQLALENPGGGFDGFLAIADKFSGTGAGNLANYYCGICYLHSGDFDKALEYLKDYSAKTDDMAAVRYGCIGDAYSEKQDYDSAEGYYKKAANATKNELIAGYYLKKLGMFYEFQNKKDDALKAYERLRRDYPNPGSNDWREVEKYIYRAGAGK